MTKSSEWWGGVGEYLDVAVLGLLNSVGLNFAWNKWQGIFLAYPLSFSCSCSSAVCHHRDTQQGLLLDLCCFLKARCAMQICPMLSAFFWHLQTLGSAGDLTFTKSAVDKSLYNLSDFFLIQAEKPLFFCFSSLGFVLYSSSVRMASVSGQIMHLLGQDVTLGWDNKHLISEKLMITGSLLTFQLSPSAMSAFSDAPTSLICKLLGCSVGSGWGHPWMESQAREEMAAITVRDTSLTGVNGQRWSSLSGEQKLFSFPPPLCSWVRGMVLDWEPEGGGFGAPICVSWSSKQMYLCSWCYACTTAWK